MREHPAHPHPDEIRVLAVIPNTLVELRLVRPLDLAAVDMAVVPPVAKSPETFSKTAGVPGRIAEGQPDDLGTFVGQGPFGDFPDLVADRRGFVENQDDAAALVVQPGKGFGVLLAPRD